MPEIEVQEKRLLTHLGSLLGVPYHQYQEIHFFDVAIRHDECFALGFDEKLNPAGLSIPIEPITADEAAEYWVRRFYQINAGETHV